MKKRKEQAMEEAKLEIEKLTGLESRRVQQVKEYMTQYKQVSHESQCIKNRIKYAIKNSTWYKPLYVSENAIKICEDEGRRVK